MTESHHFYITTPIYYVNDLPHIGHAYTTIAADVIARFQRYDNKQVLFLTGTDEHGQKVAKAAAAANLEPQQFVDNVSQNFQHLLPAINCSPDQFIRTTEPRHYHAAQHLWQTISGNGYIYQDAYSGWYSVRDEAYYQADELINGMAPTGAPVEWIEEPGYFFKLSAFRERLLDFYHHNPDFIAPVSRRNEVIRFVEGELKDLSISRSSFKWGVPIPNDPDQVMYVWLDALTNYLTALGYPDWDDNGKAWWAASHHLVGKDILRFHAVYWPAFLMAADLPLPKRIFAHGWWTNEGQKISKSLGNVIDPLQITAEYGVDVFRYFLLRAMPFGQDGDFSVHLLQERRNTELANALGNLVQRVLSFVQKYCEGKIPQFDPKANLPEDEEILRLSDSLLDRLRAAIAEQALHRYLELVFEVVASANRYVDLTKPWTLRTTDAPRMLITLAILARTIQVIAVALLPVMPQTAQTILQQLGLGESLPQSFTELLKLPLRQVGSNVAPIFPKTVL